MRIELQLRIFSIALKGNSVFTLIESFHISCRYTSASVITKNLNNSFQGVLKVDTARDSNLL